MLKTIDNYSNIFADVTVERGKAFSLFQLIFRPLYKFIKVYFIKMGFLDGLPGFILAVSNTFCIFVKQGLSRVIKNTKFIQTSIQ